MLRTSIIAIASLAGAATAQPFTMNWFSVDSGVRETSVGGTFSLNASVGQPDAMNATMIGGTFTLQGGFWANFADAPPACVADLDNDGDADADDFFAFLDAFANSNLAICDIDNDGDCDADDFFAYLDQFSQGC